MIYTTQPGESFDAEILRQELGKVLGEGAFVLNTAGNSVEIYPSSPMNGVPDYTDAERVILAHFANSATRDHNKAVDKDIEAIEQANPITHRTQREFMIGVQTMLAASMGITTAQLLDPNDPHYSHAYAKFVSINNDTMLKRAGRINK